MSKKETLVPESNLYREFHPGRWTVRRTQWFKNSIVGNPLVYTDNWAVSHYKDVQYFPTHAEALAYADKRARTREVVLPRVDDPTSIDEDDLDIMICRLDNLICIDQPSFGKPGENGLIVISSEFAEEVALALLAHAERMEE